MAGSRVGLDISSFVGGVPDLDPTFTPLDGDRNALENVARRWLTPRGSLPGDDDGDFGTDVRSWIQARQSGPSRARLKLALEAEARKEERIRSCTVTVSPVRDGLSIVGTVTLDNSSTFTLTLSVSAYATTFLSEAT